MEPEQAKTKTFQTSGNVNLADDDREISANNVATELNSMANNSKQ